MDEQSVTEINLKTPKMNYGSYSNVIPYKCQGLNPHLLETLSLGCSISGSGHFKARVGFVH